MIMAWRRIGDKPLFEPMMIQLIDAYYARLGPNELSRWISPVRDMKGNISTNLYIFLKMYDVIPH